MRTRNPDIIETDVDEGSTSWLEACHLPANYYRLKARAQREARMAVLTDWFDLAQPAVLCTSTANYLAAHRLFVDYYLKPDSFTGTRYYRQDPEHKYEMLELAMSPPLQETEPGKTALTAARLSAKTVTLVQESCTMISIVRPNSFVLISELNQERTSEEMRNIRFMIQNNERLHRDFGGPGVLFPTGRYGGCPWNDTRLSFQSFNGSLILGISIMSAHRGRHPIYGVIDDPDDGKMSATKEGRDAFFDWFFRTYLPMFQRGGKVTWIQTITHQDCLIAYAMRGLRDTGGEGAMEEGQKEKDERFDDWRRHNFPLIRESEDGTFRSIWPEYMSVEGFEQKKISYGLAAALAEYNGEIIPEGSFSFHRDPIADCYMHCVARPGDDEEYYLDLRTGHRCGWQSFLDSLFVVGAADISDSLKPTADLAGICIIGVDARGVIHVLDIYNRRCRIETQIEIAYEVMARQWHPSKFTWEDEALQSFVIRHAERYVRELEAEGFHAPQPRGMKNEGSKKTHRIIGVVGASLRNHRLRFPRLEPFTDGEGTEHHPVLHPRAMDFGRLLQQVDTYTEDGPFGHDDGIDALHMALRTVWLLRGRDVQVDQDPNQAILDDWEKAGIRFNRYNVPMECWPQSWLRDYHREQMPTPVPKIGRAAQIDPYDYQWT